MITTDRTPFYFARRPGFQLLVTQVQFVNTTQPGDVWETHRPTGRSRAYCCGVRIPVYLTRYLWTPVIALTRLFRRRIADA